MKKLLKKLSISSIVIIFMCVICLPSSAMKYTDGRFIKNTQVHEYLKEVVVQHSSYKQLSDEYSIHFDRICFSFHVKKIVGKVQSIGILVPVANDFRVESFPIYLYPKKTLYSLELVTLFLYSNEFNAQDYTFDISNSTIVEEWCPGIENEYDNTYSIMTDITEDNWEKKFSDEESVIPELCPRSLMFFEINPGQKVFVRGGKY